MFASTDSWHITFTSGHASDAGIRTSQVQNKEKEVALQARRGRAVNVLPYSKLRLAQEIPERGIFMKVGKGRGSFPCVWRSLGATVKKWPLRLKTEWLHPEQLFANPCGLLLTVFSINLIHSKDLQGSLAKQHTPEGCVLIRNFLVLILQLICWMVSGNLYVSLFSCVALSIHTLVSFHN